jgi:23S rRNA pseudouridine2605 synthase
MATIRKRGEVSLERALSKLGLASRTEARARVRDGRVLVDGCVTTDPGLPVVPERARIEVEHALVARESSLTIALHKPRGVVTTRADPQGRPTIFDYLTGVDRPVMPAGRLDMASTGLLLLTNDTRFSAWLTDPANAVSRVYVVTVRGRLEEDAARRIEHGVVDRGEPLAAQRVDVLKVSNRESHLRVTLLEGRNREIRRMMASLGHDVTRLLRVSIGGLELGGLAPGRWRGVPDEELDRAFPTRPNRPRV